MLREMESRWVGRSTSDSLDIYLLMHDPRIQLHSGLGLLRSPMGYASSGGFSYIEKATKQ